MAAGRAVPRAQETCGEATQAQARPYPYRYVAAGHVVPHACPETDSYDDQPPQAAVTYGCIER